MIAKTCVIYKWALVLSLVVFTLHSQASKCVTSTKGVQDISESPNYSEYYILLRERGVDAGGERVIWESQVDYLSEMNWSGVRPQAAVIEGLKYEPLGHHLLNWLSKMRHQMQENAILIVRGFSHRQREELERYQGQFPESFLSKLQFEWLETSEKADFLRPTKESVSPEMLAPMVPTKEPVLQAVIRFLP